MSSGSSSAESKVFVAATEPTVFSRVTSPSVSVLRWQGAQSKFDVAAIAKEWAAYGGGGVALVLLVDWSQISEWPFGTPSAADIRAWDSLAPPTSRAAFVHDQRWNRHAAVLSALLRRGNAQVRSFRPPDYEKALAWLKEASQLSIRDGVPLSNDQQSD